MANFLFSLCCLHNPSHMLDKATSSIDIHVVVAYRLSIILLEKLNLLNCQLSSV